MLSFEPEIAAARDSGTIDRAVADRLIAIERREIVPFGRELRAGAWCGVMLIATGVGIIISKHIHDIGPLAIAAAIGAAAAGCYGFAVWRRSRSEAPGPLVDYIVLLGALLISADVAFIESQWHLFGGEWQRHFLLLAVAHAVAAYAFDSRAVLSLSVAAFAAWLGIEKREVFSTSVEMAGRAFLCSATLVVWRLLNRKRDFNAVFDHFAANIAFWGALILTGNRDTRALGLVVMLILASASMIHGVRRRLELYVIYAAIYGLVALDIVIIDQLSEEAIIAFYLMVSTIACIVALIVVHFRFRRGDA